MENSETVSSYRMSSIVIVEANSIKVRTSTHVSRWTLSLLLKIIPYSISIRAADMVSYKMIVWMSNPETSRSLISVKNTPGSLDGNNQVVPAVVILFNGIFDKDVVTLSLVNHIVENP
jgi:hypothetical protein